METVVVGKIGAPYGVRGWVKVHSFTEPMANIFSYPLFIESPKNNWRPIEIEEYKEHGDGFVAKLAEVADRDQAALVTNLQLAVQRDALPELDANEYYFNDMTGMTVVNQENIELGHVVEFFATGANEVMVVRGTKEYLIPFVLDMYILSIDLQAKKMLVDWDAEF